MALILRNGGSQNPDRWLKEPRNNHLESAIPCESQAEKWTEKQRDRYFEIASKCDKETLIQHHYTSDCMHKRNRYMVDQADFIIAVWDGRPSGTGKTVQYAQRQGKLVTIINPRTMLVE